MQYQTQYRFIVECALANSVWLISAFGGRGAALQLAGYQIQNLLAGRPFSPPHCGQREGKPCTVRGGVILGTDAASVCFNDGSGDDQAHTHSGLFRCEHMFEQMEEMTRIDSSAVIFNGTANLIKCCTISTNNDFSNIGCHGLQELAPR